MTILISQQGQIFDACQAEGSGAQAETHCLFPHGTLDWLSKEGKEKHKLENSNSSPSRLPSVAPSSTVKTIDQESNNKESCNQPVANPNKRGQTLPIWKYSFRQQGNRSVSPKLGRSSLDCLNLPSSGNWLMNGLCSLQGHSRTSSGGRVKDLHSSHRCSTYDNVPSLILSTQSSTSTVCSATSCKISAAGDSVSSCAACRASDSSSLSSLQLKWVTHGSLPQSEGYLDTSMERSEACFSTSSEHSNWVAASRNSVHCSGALQSLVAELKAELIQQRAEYESSIKR